VGRLSLGGQGGQAAQEGPVGIAAIDDINNPAQGAAGLEVQLSAAKV